MAGMSVAQFFHSGEGPRLIPVVGHITGRGTVSLSEKPSPGGPVDHIALSLGDDDQIGLRVVGDDWFPAYRDGDVLIATRFDKSRLARAIGHDCILKTADGEVHIRIVKKGARKGIYTLRSLNPQDDDIEDVELEWAAPIVWINRS